MQDGLTGSAAAQRVEAVWRRARGGERPPLTGHDRTLNRIALGALGVSPEETREVLPRFDTLDDLLAWSDARAGGLDREALARFEAVVTGRPAPNTGDCPRLAQYVTQYPAGLRPADHWR